MISKQRGWFGGRFKNRKKSSVVVTIICLVIFIAGFGAGSVLTMYPDSVIGRWQNYGDPITFIISFVALVFAMITYFSIDAVEKKNKMDNNILETENYTVAYNRILKELDAETEEEYKRKLYDSVKMPDISSCMKYADWLQTIIDRIVFFGYFTWDEKKRKSFIDDIENGCKEYEDIGSGLKLLIVENVNLIRAVVEYQEQRKKNIYSYSFLEDVRGNMLKNPVAKMVYLDYLGLDYHKKAAEVMRYEIDETEFSDEYFKKWFVKGDFENKDKIGSFAKSLDDARKVVKSLGCFELSEENRNHFICENFSLLFNDYSRKIDETFSNLIERFGKDKAYSYLSENPIVIRLGMANN